VSLAPASTLTTFTLNSNTTLDGGSRCTHGTTYYAAFELIVGDAENAEAMVSDIQFAAGGSGLPPTSTDYDSGVYTVGPDDASPWASFRVTVL